MMLFLSYFPIDFKIPENKVRIKNHKEWDFVDGYIVTVDMIPSGRHHTSVLR